MLVFRGGRIHRRRQQIRLLGASGQYGHQPFHCGNIHVLFWRAGVTAVSIAETNQNGALQRQYLIVGADLNGLLIN